jgi:hypothetical protein
MTTGRPFYGRAAWACALLAILSALVAIGDWGAWIVFPQRGEELTVDNVAKSAGEKNPGEQFEIPFVFHNHSSRPIRIRGALTVCRAAGCVKLHDLFAEIPGGQEFEVRIPCTANGPGEFELIVPIFTSCRTRPQVDLKVGWAVVDLNRSESSAGMPAPPE